MSSLTILCRTEKKIKSKCCICGIFILMSLKSLRFFSKMNTNGRKENNSMHTWCTMWFKYWAKVSCFTLNLHHFTLFLSHSLDNIYSLWKSLSVAKSQSTRMHISVSEFCLRWFTFATFVSFECFICKVSSKRKIMVFKISKVLNNFDRRNSKNALSKAACSWRNFQTMRSLQNEIKLTGNYNLWTCAKIFA